MKVSSGLKISQNFTFNRYIYASFSVTFLVLVLFVADISQISVAQSLRRSLLDITSPVLSFFQALQTKTSHVSSDISDFFTAYSTLDQLREENLSLQEWKAKALQLQAENKALRAQINFVPDAYHPVATARVISYPTQLGGNRVLIKAGTADGVLENQTVVTPNGLVGRVLRSGQTTSEVILITDSQSRIPVRIEPLNQEAILSGEQSKVLSFNYLEDDVELKPGLNVFTSGKGGIFPPGLFIGTTQEIDGRVVLVPFRDWKNMNFVQILSQVRSDMGDDE